MERIFCRQGSCYLSVYANTGQYLLVLYTGMYSESEWSFFCNKMFIMWLFKTVLRQVLNCISYKPGNVLSSHFRDHFLVVCRISLQKCLGSTNQKRISLKGQTRSHIIDLVHTL